MYSNPTVTSIWGCWFWWEWVLLQCICTLLQAIRDKYTGTGLSYHQFSKVSSCRQWPTIHDGDGLHTFMIDRKNREVIWSHRKTVTKRICLGKHQRLHLQSERANRMTRGQWTFSRAVFQSRRVYVGMRSAEHLKSGLLKIWIIRFRCIHLKQFFYISRWI